MDWLPLLTLLLCFCPVAFWFCCCALGPCALFSDNFTRSDAADPGVNWTVVNGSWPITSNTLRTSSSDALVLCNTEADVSSLGPGDGYLLQLSFPTTMVADQDYKIFLNYVDSNNHYYALIRKTGSIRCISFYEVNAGTTTWLGTAPATRSAAGNDVVLVAITQCVLVSINVYDTGLPAFDLYYLPIGSLPLTSGKWGLGSGTLTSEIIFDNAVLERVRDATGTLDDCTPLGCPDVCQNIMAAGMPTAAHMNCRMIQASGTWTSTMTTPTSCFSASPITHVSTSDDDAILVTDESEWGLFTRNSCIVGATSHVPLRAILGYVDNDNYYYAEPVFAGLGDWCMTSGSGVRLYQVVGGVHNLLGEQLGHSFTDNCFTISIRFCNNWIHASAGGSGFGGFALPQVWVPHTTPDLSGTRAGLGFGAGGGTAVVWTAITRDDGFQGDTCPACTGDGDWCACGDSDHIPSHTAELVVSGFTAPCTAMNGTLEAVNRFGCQWIYCYPGTPCGPGNVYRLVVAYNPVTDKFEVRQVNTFTSALIGESATGISCVDGTFTVTGSGITVQVTFNGD